MMAAKKGQDTLVEKPCRRCGYGLREHYRVNYADGPHVSVGVLVCPTAIYEPGRKRRQRTGASR